VSRALTILALLLLTSLCSQAQSLSVGGKTGLNSFLSLGNGIVPNDLEPTGGYLTNATGTLMARYIGKKKWGVEAGLSYAVLNQSSVSNYWSLQRTNFQVTDYYLLDISVQWELSCDKWQQNKLLKRLKVYIGAGISGGLAVHTYSYTEHQPEARNIVEGRGMSYGAMLLLNQTATYRLNKEFSFLLSSDLETMPWQYFGNSQRNSMGAAQLGLIYHIH
jgi:hypothetical protein